MLRVSAEQNCDSSITKTPAKGLDTVRINQDNFGIYIVTYNRQKALNKSIRLYLESLPFVPPITVISNHSKCLIDDDLKQYVKVIDNVLRPDESWGYLARNWNQCFQLGLVDHEWLLCSQDDVIINPGWLELVDSTNFDFYSAPLGDTRFLLNRSAFRRVGWFDERFCGLGFQEHDYLMRVLNLIPESASIVDQHKQTIRHNSVGLENYWFQPEERVGFSKVEQVGGQDHGRFWHIYRHNYFKLKWGTTPFKKVFGIAPLRLPKEFDWYPFISGRYDFLRITNVQYRFGGSEWDIAVPEWEKTINAKSEKILTVPKCEILGYCHLEFEPDRVLLDRLIDHVNQINVLSPNSLGLVVLLESADLEQQNKYKHSDFMSIYGRQQAHWHNQFATLTDFNVIFKSRFEGVTDNGYPRTQLCIQVGEFLTMSLDRICDVLSEKNIPLVREGSQKALEVKSMIKIQQNSRNNQKQFFQDIYDRDFYKDHGGESLSSAKIIVPFVLDVFPVNSVVDVGCGNGAWLHVFQSWGVGDIQGFDANDLSDEDYLVEKKYIKTGCDFSSSQFSLDVKADMSISLEVAEHLPDEAADAFVGNLVNAAEVVLFSAAIPGQKGVHHINEQPSYYWREKFNNYEYVEIDFIRPLIWGDARLPWWRRQNTTLFVHRGYLEKNQKAKALAARYPELKNQACVTAVSEWILKKQNDSIEAMELHKE